VAVAPRTAAPRRGVACLTPRSGAARGARIAWRRAQLAGYFRRARPCVVSLRQMAVYDLDRLTSGALVALRDAEGFTLAWGSG